MAEKRVSVRLSATGGEQVRAELDGVGETGAGIAAEERRPSAWRERDPGWGGVPHKLHLFQGQTGGSVPGPIMATWAQSAPPGRCQATQDGHCLPIAYSAAPARVSAIVASAQAR